MAQTRIQRRKRIFVGTEGQSEKSFAAWLQRLCDAAGVPVHLDIQPGQGGDSLAIVQHAVKKYRSRDRGFKSAIILLDKDRLEEDQRSGRDPREGLKGAPLKLIFMKPKLEGVLIRLHEGQEQRFLTSAARVEKELSILWPEYRKPCSAELMLGRFDLSDLRRAARSDNELQTLLAELGL